MTGASSDTRRAIVVGGSLAGLFTAVLLRYAGWDAQVYERSSGSLAGRGAGIATHAELFEVMDRSGAHSGEALGVEVPGRRTLDAEGRVVGEFQYPQVLTSWDRIYRPLLGALPAQCYHAARALEAIEVGRGRVTAVFADGSRASGDLLVGADGFRSTVRGIVLPALRPRYAGYVAWRGLVDEARLSGFAHAALFDRMVFCLPAGEQMLGYPVSGENEDLSPGRRRYNFVWYRPADAGEDLPRLLTEATGTVHTLSIPPDRIDPRIVAEMRADARSLLAPQFAEVVEATPQPFLQPIYDLEAPTLVGERVVLVGDAGYVARPHAGMGVTKAAGDAVVLADALAAHPGDLDRGLAEFDQRRVAFGRAVVRHGRALGEYLARAPGVPARDPSPEEVMSKVAISDPIYARLATV